MQQIDPVEALEWGVHPFATVGTRARDSAPRARLRQGL